MEGPPSRHRRGCPGAAAVGPPCGPRRDGLFGSSARRSSSARRLPVQQRVSARNITPGAKTAREQDQDRGYRATSHGRPRGDSGTPDIARTARTRELRRLSRHFPASASGWGSTGMTGRSCRSSTRCPCSSMISPAPWMYPRHAIAASSVSSAAAYQGAGWQCRAGGLHSPGNKKTADNETKKTSAG